MMLTQSNQGLEKLFNECHSGSAAPIQSQMVLSNTETADQTFKIPRIKSRLYSWLGEEHTRDHSQQNCLNSIQADPPPFAQHGTS